MWIEDDDFKAVSFYKETKAERFGAGLVFAEEEKQCRTSITHLQTLIG